MSRLSSVNHNLVLGLGLEPRLVPEQEQEQALVLVQVLELEQVQVQAQEPVWVQVRAPSQQVVVTKAQ